MSHLRTFTRLFLLFLTLTYSYAYAASDTNGTSGAGLKVKSSGSGTVSTEVPADVTTAAPAKKYRDGELLVKLKPNLPEKNKKNLHQKHGAEKLAEFEELRLHHVKLKKGMSVEDGVKEYQADPDVEYAEPNYLFQIQSLPNDTKFAQQWALHNTGQTGGTPGVDIKATAAWNITTGSSNVVVAILDTGIDYTHPDLVANIYSTRGYNAVNHSNDPFDYHGHGTHVAGIIGAAGNNGLGIAGVNWNVKLTACKCVDNSGYASSNAVVECLQWVKSQKNAGVNIVATNNSWGTSAAYYSSSIYDAVKAQPDILFVSAAGNGGGDPDEINAFSTPSAAKLPNAIVVAASDDKDYKSSFSNFGKFNAHLMAPGEGILSTLPASNSYGISGGYGTLSGTSMATPYVTGVAALLKAQDPSRNWATIKNLILAGGEDTAGSYGHTMTRKRLSAYGSMACSNTPVFAVQDPPYGLTVGSSVTLSALSINCGASSGPVIVVTRDWERVTLHDDGVAPDLVANDGIFSASFVPTRTDEVLSFSFPAGVQTLEYPRTEITSSGPTWTQTLTYQGPVITTTHLPNPTLNTPYTSTLAVQGGYPTSLWRLASGSLPDGITLSPIGELSGSATTPGSFYFTVEVADSYGAIANKELSMTVTPDGYSEAWRNLGPPVSQAYVWETVEDNHSDVAIDRDGNSYVTLDYGYYGPSLVKYDPAGNQLWAKTFSLETFDNLYAVTADLDGNVYAAGKTGSPSRNWLLKFDRDGNELWRKDGPASMNKDVVTDAAGNVYVMTSVEIIKYDGAGNELWTRDHQLSTINTKRSMTIDAGGSIYLTGYEGTSTQKVMLARYDSAGNLLWYKTYDNGVNATGQEVAVNSRGEIYIAATSMTAPLTGYLMKVDAAGNLLWNKPYSAGKGTKFTGLALDGMDRVYVTGSGLFSPYGGSDFMILKYDADGNVLWSMTPDTGRRDYGDAIAIGPSGEIVVSSRNDWNLAVIKYSHDVPLVSLDYTRQGTGAGTVRLAPGGALASSSSRFYDPATVVTLTAVPEGDSVFTGWGGACSGTGACIVTMDQRQLVSATFDHKPISLNYTRLGDGAGRVSFAPGSTCFGSCAEYYDAGTTVTITAAVTGTSVFTGWGGACSGTGACTVLADQSKEVTATFVHGPRISYQKAGTGVGWVRFIPEGADPFYPDICYDQNCVREYSPGTPVTLTAQSSPSATFTGWSGGCSGTGACTVTLTADTPVTANFARIAPKASLAAGFGHTLALFGGTLWGWGNDMDGEVGIPGASQIQSPIVVPAPPMAKVVAAKNGYSSAGIGVDGNIYNWGSNALVNMGGTFYTGSDHPISVPGLAEMVDVALGTSHGLGVKADGSLMGWWDNSAGQVGIGTPDSPVAPTALPDTSGFLSVAAGSAHSLALKNDGTVWAWGYNAHGQTGLDPAQFPQTLAPGQVNGVAGVVAIAAGGEHTVALKDDGTVVTWGMNDSGQLGDGTLTDRWTPQAVPGLSGVTAIAAGHGFSMALRTDGTLWVWGNNDYGQLATGNTARQTLPVQVQGLSTVVGMTAGSFHAVAETSDGALWAWGANWFGQLGDGTSYQRNTPVRVSFFNVNQLPPAPPMTTASPFGGTYTSTQTVTLTPSRSATIYYTIDGTEPTTASAVYTAPLTISSTTNLKYFAVDTDGNVEQVRTQTYAFPLVADFTGTVITGNAPLTVSFTDLSSGNPSSWLWNFGDGSSDTARNPTHLYSKAGTYTVSLTASNPGASDTKTRRGYLTVLSCAEAPARITGAFTTSFADLLSAYTQAVDNDVIELQEYNFSSDLTFDKEIRVSLKGGYDCSYQDNLSAAGIFGKLSVKAGRVKLENIRLR